MPAVARAILVAFGWAFVWVCAAIALAMELVRLMTPDALSSRFFFMWTFARGAYWFMPGWIAGMSFVLAEARIRGDASRETSRAGWWAFGIGGAMGLVVTLLPSSLDALTSGESIDPLALVFGVVTGATCGLMTFLVDRQIGRFAARHQRATT